MEVPSCFISYAKRNAKSWCQQDHFGVQVNGPNYHDKWSCPHANSVVSNYDCSSHDLGDICGWLDDTQPHPKILSLLNPEPLETGFIDWTNYKLRFIFKCLMKIFVLNVIFFNSCQSNLLTSKGHLWISFADWSCQQKTHLSRLKYLLCLVFLFLNTFVCITLWLYNPMRALHSSPSWSNYHLYHELV